MLTETINCSPVSQRNGQEKDNNIYVPTVSVVNQELRCRLENLGVLLQLGCGKGCYSEVLGQAAEKMIASDMCAEMVAIAKMALTSCSNIIVEHVDCCGTHYPDRSFDTVFIGELLEVVPRPADVVEEARRILDCEGRLVLLSSLSVASKTQEVTQPALQNCTKDDAYRKKCQLRNCEYAKRLLIGNNFIVRQSCQLGQGNEVFLTIAEKVTDAGW